MDDALLTSVDNADVAQLYGRAQALQVCDRYCLLCRRCLRELSSLLISRSGDTKVYAVVTTVTTVIA